MIRERLPESVREEVRDMGLFGGLAASAVDLVFYGGETLVAVGLILVDQVDILLALVGQGSRLSDILSGGIGSTVELVFAVVVVVFIASTLARLGRRAVNRVSD